MPQRREIEWAFVIPQTQYMRIILIFCLGFFAQQVQSQKMVLLERANRVRTEKFYIGDVLRFRLQGKETYWYQREITDILPASQLILLDNQPTPLANIDRMRLQRDPLVRACGGALLTFGVTLAIANTVSYFRNDGDATGPLYAASALSGVAGYFLIRPKVLKFGKKHRLRAVEVPLMPNLKGR